MFEVKPWDEKSEKILRELALGGRTSTYDMKLSREFSKRKEIRLLTDNKINMLDITGNRRKQKTVFSTPLDVMVMPRITPKGLKYQFKRF